MGNTKKSSGGWWIKRIAETGTHGKPEWGNIAFVSSA